MEVWKDADIEDVPVKVKEKRNIITNASALAEMARIAVVDVRRSPEDRRGRMAASGWWGGVFLGRKPRGAVGK